MGPQFFDRIKSLIEQYNIKFEPFGVECAVHRRSFTADVASYGYNSHIIHKMAESLYNRKEKAEFHNAPNRYKTVILSVQPLQKGIVEKSNCKRYSFVVESIERAHKGKEPKYAARNDEKLFKLIEKRLTKLLKRAGKETDVSWCKNNFIDKMRYAFSGKYH